MRRYALCDDDNELGGVETEHERVVREEVARIVRSTTNPICDDLVLAPRPHAPQSVGKVSFDSAHLYDNTLADTEHCSAGQERVVAFGVLLAPFWVPFAAGGRIQGGQPYNDFLYGHI